MRVALASVTSGTAVGMMDETVELRRAGAAPPAGEEEEGLMIGSASHGHTPCSCVPKPELLLVLGGFERDE